MPEYSAISKQFEDHFRLRTKPIAIKMLANEAEIPAGAVRPLKDMGHHLSLCQAFSLARRQGQTTALLLEDNWCFEPVVGLGFKAPPAIFLDGTTATPRRPAAWRPAAAGPIRCPSSKPKNTRVWSWRRLKKPVSSPTSSFCTSTLRRSPPAHRRQLDRRQRCHLRFGRSFGLCVCHRAHHAQQAVSGGRSLHRGQKAGRRPGRRADFQLPVERLSPSSTV